MCWLIGPATMTSTWTVIPDTRVSEIAMASTSELLMVRQIWQMSEMKILITQIVRPLGAWKWRSLNGGSLSGERAQEQWLTGAQIFLRLTAEPPAGATVIKIRFWSHSNGHCKSSKMGSGVQKISTGEWLRSLIKSSMILWTPTGGTPRILWSRSAGWAQGARPRPGYCSSTRNSKSRQRLITSSRLSLTYRSPNI